MIRYAGNEGEEYPAESLKRAARSVRGLRRNAMGKDSPRASAETQRLSCDKRTQTSIKPGGTAKRLSPQHNRGERRCFIPAEGNDGALP